MTRIKLELTAVDDLEALFVLHRITDMMYDDMPLKPGYGTSDLDGSCECTVTREDNGIERGIEVTL